MERGGKEQGGGFGEGRGREGGRDEGDVRYRLIQAVQYRVGVLDIVSTATCYSRGPPIRRSPYIRRYLA